MIKVLCPHCERLTELSRYRLDGSALVVTCARCGVESRVDSAGARPDETVPNRVASSKAPVRPALATSPSPPPQRGLALVSSAQASNVVSLRTANTEAVAHAAQQASAPNPFAVPEGLCPKCLARRSANQPSCGQCGLIFAQADVAVLAAPSWLEDAWRSLLAVWGDEERHEKLRKEAVLRDELITLGRLYQLRLALLPEDPYAQRGREELLALAAAAALAPLDTGGTSRGATLKTVFYGAVVLFALGAFGLLGWALLSSGSR